MISQHEVSEVGGQPVNHINNSFKSPETEVDVIKKAVCDGCQEVTGCMEIQVGL